MIIMMTVVEKFGQTEVWPTVLTKILSACLLVIITELQLSVGHHTLVLEFQVVPFFVRDFLGQFFFQF